MTRRRMSTITLIAMAIVYLLWNVPELAFLTYPLRLFVTYVHESGHGLMAILSGGKVVQFTVSPNGSGLAVTAGGSRALILPAGYLGAAFFGASLFYILNTRPYARTISIILGVLLLIFTALYARPDASGALTAIVIGLLMGGGLIAMGWNASKDINLLVLNVLAIMISLNAVLDVWALVRHSGSTIGNVRNDAAAFSHEIAPILPGSVWAAIWALSALAMLGAAIYYSIINPLVYDSPGKLNPEDKKK